MGKKQEALATYRLAAASIEPNNAQSDVIEQITKSIARLGGTKGSNCDVVLVPNSSLQTEQ
jgi:hypothetical protein